MEPKSTSLQGEPNERLPSWWRLHWWNFVNERLNDKTLDPAIRRWYAAYLIPAGLDLYP